MLRIRAFVLAILLVMLAVSPEFCEAEDSILLIPASELGLSPVLLRVSNDCIHASIEENGNIHIVP